AQREAVKPQTCPPLEIPGDAWIDPTFVQTMQSDRDGHLFTTGSGQLCTAFEKGRKGIVVVHHRPKQKSLGGVCGDEPVRLGDSGAIADGDDKRRGLKELAGQFSQWLAGQLKARPQ